MVTGRPHRPSDQGSVENMNKLVKRTLGMVLSEYRVVGKDRNWTEVLGSVASAINLQHGREKMRYPHMRQCMAKKWTMTSHV
jgi:transposase